MSTTQWTLDPAHSDVLFSIKHLGISTVRGKFTGLSGTASFDPADHSTLQVHVDITSASFNTGNDDRDAHVKGADFLDAEKFPTITFDATKVNETGDGEGTLTGNLTIRGVTKEVVLHVEGPSGEITDPYGNVKIGASATATINRKDFGIAFNHVMEAGALLLGEDVKITIDVQFTKQAAG